MRKIEVQISSGNFFKCKQNIFYFVFFIFILSPALLFSQHRFLHERVKFERVTFPMALSNNSVFSVSQDSKGFLWVATNNGLNRFDGYSSTVFRNIPNDSLSLSDNRILSSLEDIDGSIWVGTMEGGINKYNPKTKKFIRYSLTTGNERILRGGRVFSIFRDSEQSTWIGTSSGLFLYDRKKDAFKDASNLLSGNKEKFTIRFITENYRKELLIGSAKGLYIINPKRTKVEHISAGKAENSLSNNFINSLTFDRNSKLYIATEEGVNIYDPVTKKITKLLKSKTGNSINSNLINSVLFDQSGYLWIGTNRGLDIYHPETKQFRHFSNLEENSSSISWDFINHIYEDKSGNIWISTFAGGLNKYIKPLPNIQVISNSIFSKFSISNYAISLTEFSGNELIVGTYDGLGFINYKKNFFLPLYKNPDRTTPLSACITSIKKDPFNNIWFGTLSKGLAKFNLQNKSLLSFTPETNPKINDWNVNGLQIDKDTILWISTISGGIGKFNIKTGDFLKLINIPDDNSSLSSNRVKTIFLDSKDNLWVGTEMGLNLLDKRTNKFRRFDYFDKHSTSINDQIITSIAEDKNGNLWLGTYSGGVVFFNTQSFSFMNMSSKSALLTEQIFGLLVDNHNALWIAGAYGVLRYDINRGLLTVFDESDGIKANNFLESGQLKMSDGKLAFCGHNGLIIINPDNIFEKSSDHQIMITDFKVFGKSKNFDKDITEVKEIDLDYTENYFTIEFASLDHRNSRKINYSYKMEGFDQDWIDCGKLRQASYMNLSGKTYFFKIRASRNDGSWYESTTPLTLHIASPPWERWYAYVTYILLLTAIVVIIVNIRTRIQNQNIKILEERQKVLAESKQTLTNLIRRFTQLQEEERSYISRELHDGINQTIASIKLGIDKLMIDKKTPEFIMPDLSSLQSHLKQIITEIRNISQNIRPSVLDHFGIFSAVETLCREFEMKTEIPVDVKSHNFNARFSYEVESNLYRIIQEALNNIRKHSDATKVEIIFSSEKDVNIILIRDNGKGFSTDNIFTPEFAREHFGLNNMRKRAELIGAQFDLKSSAEAGSEIVITLTNK